jgi:hypothetical protein
MDTLVVLVLMIPVVLAQMHMMPLLHGHLVNRTVRRDLFAQTLIQLGQELYSSSEKRGKRSPFSGITIGEHGLDGIGKVLDQVSGKSSRTGADLLQAIKKVTDENMRQRLRRYQIFQTDEEFWPDTPAYSMPHRTRKITKKCLLICCV